MRMTPGREDRWLSRLPSGSAPRSSQGNAPRKKPPPAAPSNNAMASHCLFANAKRLKTLMQIHRPDRKRLQPIARLPSATPGSRQRPDVALELTRSCAIAGKSCTAGRSSARWTLPWGWPVPAPGTDQQTPPSSARSTTSARRGRVKCCAGAKVIHPGTTPVGGSGRDQATNWSQSTRHLRRPIAPCHEFGLISALQKQASVYVTRFGMKLAFSSESA